MNVTHLIGTDEAGPGIWDAVFNLHIRNVGLSGGAVTA